jgi:hypothetical protein
MRLRVAAPGAFVRVANRRHAPKMHFFMNSNIYIFKFMSRAP